MKSSSLVLLLVLLLVLVLLVLTSLLQVVDLWGGYAGTQCKRGQYRLAWEENTLCSVFSSAKGITAFALALQKSRGLIDVDKTVASYWRRRDR